MKIILINHTFQIPRFYKRWQLLANEHRDLDVTLITPNKAKWDIKGSMIFGSDTVIEGKGLNNGNFHIIPVQIQERKFLGWISDEMVKVIKEIKPDIVYHIGGHTQPSLMQCIKTVRKYLPNSKVMAFSMRGPAYNLIFPRLRKKESRLHWIARIITYYVYSYRVKYLNKNCDAILCHYPTAIKCFKDEGFKKPIYMSTQVGVDTDVYYPDAQKRRRIRTLYNLGDAFVFGCACRFIPNKGLFEIVDALPQEGNWKCLLMGKGENKFTESLIRQIKEKHLEDKIILTGYIEWNEMPAYWNAIDCALHVPQTTDTWQETFSLAIVQAMATGKPVIGNTSGSVPYQIGVNKMIVPEGDIQALTEKIIWTMQHRDEAMRIGLKMRNYAINSFSIKNLNKQFYDIIQDVYHGVYNKNKVDMVNYAKNNGYELR